MTVPAEEVVPYSGLVTLPELQAYMAGINLNPLQGQAAISALFGVQSDLEQYLNRPVQPMQIREVVSTDAQGIAYLSVTPVWKVIRYDSVENYAPLSYVVDAPYVPPTMERDPLIGDNGRMIDHLYPVVNDPLLLPGGFNAGVPSSRYAVEYVGGYNGYADDQLKLAIMRVAAREVAHNHDESLNFRGDNAEQNNPQDSRPKGWTEEELAKFDRIRRRVIV